MDKEDVVHIHSSTLISHKKKKATEAVEVMWMNLESVIQSKVSQKE